MYHKWNFLAALPGRYKLTFGATLKKLRLKSGKSRYRLAQYSGLDEAYILRLESGQRQNPSRDTVMKLCLALVAKSDVVSLQNVNALLLAGGYAPLRSRGEAELVS